MLLIPVVLLIGGILALVLYLEKDLHPIKSKGKVSRLPRRTGRRVAATADLLRKKPRARRARPRGVMTRMTSCRACGAMISADASSCPRCGASFNLTLVAPVGIAIMLAIAVLYAIFQRYW